MILSLVVEELDPETSCIKKCIYFDVSDVAELSNVLNIDLSEDMEVDYIYILNELQIKSLIDFYKLNGLSGVGTANLRSRAPFDDLPYELHTGRELSLMLAGVKPMAYFVYHDGCEFRYPIEEAFDKFLISGNIVKHEYKLRLGAADQPLENYVIFTLSGEEWRANALILLMRSLLKCGWSEGLERMEGTLLGYEEWQNDVYIEYLAHNFKKR